MSDDHCTIKREPMSNDIIKLAADVANQANDIASKLAVKLDPVCRQEPTEGVSEKEILKQYPPYFEELHNLLRGIRKSLLSIESTISRCEV